MARLFCGHDRIARSVSDFVLITIARNRAQQAPIAINAGVGMALVALSFARPGADPAARLLAAPLMLAFWTVIGLRAAFFVPSELPAAWAFAVHAPAASVSYARGVCAAIIGFVVPLAAVLAYAVGGWRQLVVTALLVVALAQGVALTISALPFTCPYRPGHAKLKTRWPIYLVTAYTFAYGLPNVPILVVVIAIVALEIVLTRSSRRQWTVAAIAGDSRDENAATTLDLITGTDTVPEITIGSVAEAKEPPWRGTLADVRGTPFACSGESEPSAASSSERWHSPSAPTSRCSRL